MGEVRNDDPLTALPSRCLVFDYTPTDRYGVARPESHLNVKLRKGEDNRRVVAKCGQDRPAPWRILRVGVLAADAVKKNFSALVNEWVDSTEGGL